MLLIHYSPLLRFYTHWFKVFLFSGGIEKQPLGFLVFSGVIEKQHGAVMS